MANIYGYARISTSKQSISRQVQNILDNDNRACIVKETFTGTISERPQWVKLISTVTKGDTIIFDEVSRMSRNAAEGFETYKRLYAQGIELVFLKEPHINTSVYRNTMQNRLSKVGDDIGDLCIDFINQLIERLQQKQIELAFESAEHEVQFLRRRTSEGIKQAKLNGKQIGRRAGTVIETSKARQSKRIIKKHSADFGGNLNDNECIRLSGLSRNTYYKYKRELKEGA